MKYSFGCNNGNYPIMTKSDLSWMEEKTQESGGSSLEEIQLANPIEAIALPFK